MVLQKIHYFVDCYKQILQSKWRHEEAFKWESIALFQANWNVEAPNFKEMFQKSLHNSHSKRLWVADNYAPKDMMLHFIDLDPEMVRMMFRGLFNESKNVAARVDRFQFYCDEMLTTYKDKHHKNLSNQHYHDSRMISLYLGLQFPQQYTLLEWDAFRAFMQAIDAKDVPDIPDVERFFKVMKTLYNIVSKDQKLLDLHQARLDGDAYYKGETLWLVQDLYWSVMQKMYQS